MTKQQHTSGIEIVVEPEYLSEHSTPSDDRYMFAYTVTIKNVGAVAAKLLSRHWYVSDAFGEVQEFVGEGVVGEQPYLKPGEGFTYTSGSLMETPVGSMHGYFDMLGDDGEVFKAEIPKFLLSAPRVLH